jgi:hypothetical protein
MCQHGGSLWPYSRFSRPINSPIKLINYLFCIKCMHLDVLKVVTVFNYSIM